MVFHHGREHRSSFHRSVVNRRGDLSETPIKQALIAIPRGTTILSCTGIHTAVITMPDFLFEFLGRVAVMLPVVLILVVVLWLIFNRRRHDTFAPAFSPSDMRTWSLRFALLDGAVFAVIFALLSALMADSQFSAGVAGGLAALVAMGLMPWLATRYAKPSNK